jgi:acyl-CoA thioesterase-2
MEHGERPPRIDEIDFRDLFDLSAHGSDTYVGRVARYPWGNRLFGGQVVAQALRAAIHTVDADRAPHSFHSYFIRPGSPFEPVRFEVERLRDGRSFTTRQVVARQSAGAILNASVSFQGAEPDEVDVQMATLDPELPSPEDPSLRNDSWGALLDRRAINLPGDRYGYWIRLLAELGDDPILNVCGLTFMSDAAPFRAGRSAHPEFSNDQQDRERFVGASLDHSLWFHRPTLANEWHWFDTRSHGLAHGRGLATGDVITADGVHAATLAQQVLLRRNRNVE